MTEHLIKNSSFVSFDGAVEISTSHQRPDRLRHLEIDFGSRPRIGRGGGYSFSAASFGDKVLVQEMIGFDRFLDFDPVAMTIRVEAGMPLGKLMEWVMARGLYFPVLPGYPGITVGGCVAADVHGKNPWKDGTFSEWVTQMSIFHPMYGYMKLSQGENNEVFTLTCGGFGMTGIIVDVTLQLTLLPSQGFVVRKIPVRSLGETLMALSEYSDSSDFIYSWHDGARRGENFGTGVVFCGKWLESRGRDIEQLAKCKLMTARSRAAIPFGLWNGTTSRYVNRMFHIMNQSGSSAVLGVRRATFPFAFNTLYHRFYGQNGLAEIQVLVGENDVHLFLTSLQKLVERHNPPLVLMSLKRFRGRQISLSITGSGFLVALNFYRNGELPEFLRLIDQLLIETGAQPNLSKDSRVSRTVTSLTLPNYDDFKARLLRFDPLRIYQSELSHRIGV